MGGSKSHNTVTHKNSTLTVSNEDIKILNEQLNQTVTNVSMEQAKDCGQTLDTKNLIDLSDSVVGGDINIGAGSNGEDCRTNLTTKQNATFSCIQASTITNDIGQQMMEQILQKLESGYTNDALNSMEDAANQSAAAGSMAIGSDSSTSNDVNTDNTFVSKTNISKNLQNVVRNAVTSNFSAKDVQNCMDEVNAKQGIDAHGAIVGGSVNICNYSSDIVQNIYGKCVQQSDTGSKITTDLVATLGLENKDTAESSSTNVNSTEVTQESKTTGPLQDLGTAFMDLGTGIGNAAGGLLSFFGLGVLGPMASPISSICCCCIIMILMFTMMGGGGEDSDDSSGVPSGVQSYGSYGYGQYGGTATSVWKISSATSSPLS